MLIRLTWIGLSRNSSKNAKSLCKYYGILGSTGKRHKLDQKNPDGLHELAFDCFPLLLNATGLRFDERMSDPNLSSFIWSVADLLRGDYKQSEYGKVILPFTVLRRLDCVLEPTKTAVLTELAKRTQAKVNPEPFLLKKSGVLFYNTSPLDLKKLMGDQDHIGENLRA